MTTRFGCRLALLKRKKYNEFNVARSAFVICTYTN